MNEFWKAKKLDNRENEGMKRERKQKEMRGKKEETERKKKEAERKKKEAERKKKEAERKKKEAERKKKEAERKKKEAERKKKERKRKSKKKRGYLHSNGSHSRTTTTVRNAEGFVQVQVTNIGSIITRSTEANLCIHVCTIQVHLS